MLLHFKVENFKSFGDEQCLSMIPGPVRNHSEHIIESDGRKALGLAMIFGANASGKSGLIDAMGISWSFITDMDWIQKSLYNRRLAENVNKPTGFEYMFTYEGHTYSYGFEILLSNGNIMQEWLVYLQDGKHTFVFHRQGKDAIAKLLESDPTAHNIFKVCCLELESNPRELLLRRLSRFPSEHDSPLNHVVRAMYWFRNKLRVFPTDGVIPDSGSGKRDELAERVLPAFGTGVSGIEFEKVDNIPGLPPVLMRELESGKIVRLSRASGYLRLSQNGEEITTERMVSRHGDVRFNFNEESDGTQRLYELIPIFDDAEPDDVTYVIDELHRSLHPKLTRKFIKEFLKISKMTKRQLIMTTHESRLLDLNLVRRDEVWFVEKKHDSDSELYSLEHFAERGDKRIDRMYLDGRYGAVPIFDTFYPDLE